MTKRKIIKKLDNNRGASLLEFALAASILTAVFVSGGLVYQNATQSRFDESVNAVSESAFVTSNLPDEYSGLCDESYVGSGSDNLGLGEEACL